jgi:hypothetical protein
MVPSSLEMSSKGSSANDKERKEEGDEEDVSEIIMPHNDSIYNI